jgi:glycerol-3-phosphate O-acyltransferase/dihydroxyacetone phosphate acyltransferase
MALGESIAVFPEGTSHTEPRLLNLKDGVSWSALEYVRYLRGTPENGGPKKGDKAKIVPVGIVYEDKSKWRSRVVVRFGPPISMDEYESEFLSENDGAARSAVKKLTRRIEIEMFKLTINAPDW